MKRWMRAVPVFVLLSCVAACSGDKEPTDAGSSESADRQASQRSGGHLPPPPPPKASDGNASAAAPLQSDQEVGATFDDAVGKELKALKGTWVVVSLEFQGNETLTSEATGELRYTFDGDRLAVQGAPEALVTIDPTTKPKTLEITTPNGGAKAQDMQAVYELAGDSLTICYAPKGHPRPTRIRSEGMAFVMRLKRQKP